MPPSVFCSAREFTFSRAQRLTPDGGKKGAAHGKGAIAGLGDRATQRRFGGHAAIRRFWAATR